MRRCCRSASSCGQDSAALDCRIFLSFRIRRLAWRLARAAKEAAQRGPQARGQEVEGH
jgi:hypothetical protein